MNGYHYVGGSVLNARDPIGLAVSFVVDAGYTGSADLAARLFEAGRRMVEDMRVGMWNELGIATYVSRVEQGSSLTLSLSDVEAQNRAHWEALQNRVRPALEAAWQALDNRQQAAMNHDTFIQGGIDQWELARSQMMAYVGRDRRVTLEARSAASWLTTAADSSAGPAPQSVNPFTWWLQTSGGSWIRAMTGTSDRALVSRGPVADALHDSVHATGCIGPDRGPCRAVGGWVEGDETVQNIDDFFLRNVGAPERIRYYPYAVDGRDDPGDVTTDAHGHPTQLLDNGESVTGPSSRELETGVRE